MTPMQITAIALTMAGMTGFAWLANRFLTNWSKGIDAMREHEKIRDRVFRDALDTIHHLRMENDQLTAMVMAMANREDD